MSKCTLVFFSTCILGATALGWTYSVTLFHHPELNYDGTEGESMTFTGHRIPERVTFSRCFGWTSSAKYTIKANRGGCLCFHHGRDGSGLSRCFDNLNGEGEIPDFIVLGIDNFPTSFTVLDQGDDECISVPHYPARATTQQRSGC